MSSAANIKNTAARVAVKVPFPDSLVEVRMSPPESNFEVKVTPGGEVIELLILPGCSQIEVRITEARSFTLRGEAVVKAYALDRAG